MEIHFCTACASASSICRTASARSGSSQEGREHGIRPGLIDAPHYE
jgi:hypothetical protein